MEALIGYKFPVTYAGRNFLYLRTRYIKYATDV
jgi:hypothetical protein